MNTLVEARHLATGVTVFALVVAAQALAQPAPVAVGAPRVVSMQPESTQPMDRLIASAQRLRESVQAMATQPAGEHRNQAIRQAHDALVETQQAMILAAALATAALPMIIVAPPALAMDVLEEPWHPGGRAPLRLAIV